MFSKVIVDNFTAFNHFEFDLTESKTDKKAKKLAIIYGENGIGKTCLIKCFKLLKNSFESLIFVEGMSRFLASARKNSQDNPKGSLEYIFASLFDDNRISGYLKNYYKINSHDEMKVSYEIIINKKKYVYSMVFNRKAIVKEKLMCNGEIVFSCFNNRVDLIDKYFLNNELREKLLNSFSMYFGDKHTFLSCINYLKRDVSSAFFKQGTSRDVLLFMNFLESMIVVTKEDEMNVSPLSIPNYTSTFLNPISSGSYNDKKKQQLDKTQSALSMFFSSLYSNIQSVEYQIDTFDSGERQYHLYFVENKNNEILRVPFELESTGTKKMATLFTNLYELVRNKETIVIDEIDNGINDILFRSVFESLDNSIVGQFIVTTHNTLLLRYPIKKNIYLLDRDENNQVISYSLDEFGRKIQAGTDIVGQYLKGLYGGVPQSGAFSMKYISEALDNNE